MDGHGKLRLRRLLDGEPCVGAADVGDENRKGEGHAAIWRRRRAGVKRGAVMGRMRAEFGQRVSCPAR